MNAPECCFDMYIRDYQYGGYMCDETDSCLLQMTMLLLGQPALSGVPIPGSQRQQRKWDWAD